MTEQEIEKLREKLGSEYSVKRLNGSITVELADIWDGVDFYENHLGIVKPISESFRKEIKSGVKFLINPSTEAAYVEQLKANAHELYGEIKDGDRFDSRHLRDGLSGSDELHDIEKWHYEKETDTLYSAPECCGGFIIYREGKWAKKVEEPIRVKIELMQTDSLDRKVLRFSLSQPVEIKDEWEFFNHIEEAIESYLNKKP